MEGPGAPPFFICPISLQIMEDPVTICTGMTYDRESIRQWLFVYNKSTCPVTKQVITDRSLIPNSTLLRLIHSWRAADADDKIRSTEAIETIDINDILEKLIKEVKNSETPLKALKELKSLLKQNDSNKRLMEEAGLVQLLSTIVIKNYTQAFVVVLNQFERKMVGEEALILLSLLPINAATATDLASMDFISCLSWVLQRGSYNARFHSVAVLKSICEAVPESFLMDLKTELFDGIVEILKDQNPNQATMAALLILMEVCPWGKNGIKAIEAGVVPVIVEFLAENEEMRKCTEAMLGVLDLLCARAEGREAFLAHPVSVAAVTRKIFRVSNVANEKAVRLLWLVCKHSSSPYLIQEMADVGAVLKLCMVLQTVCNSDTRDRAKEILCLHWKTWKASPCVPLQGWVVWPRRRRREEMLMPLPECSA